jgi:hypothetical protein
LRTLITVDPNVLGDLACSWLTTSAKPIMTRSCLRHDVSASDSQYRNPRSQDSEPMIRRETSGVLAVTTSIKPRGLSQRRFMNRRMPSRRDSLEQHDTAQLDNHPTLKNEASRERGSVLAIC